MLTLKQHYSFEQFTEGSTKNHWSYGESFITQLAKNRSRTFAEPFPTLTEFSRSFKLFGTPHIHRSKMDGGQPNVQNINPL